MNKKRERADNDSAWKDVLTDLFPEFIAFFFSDIQTEIDWTRGYQFLDKELAKIARGHRTGKRLADKLDIDLLAAAEKKLKLNAEKYPADVVRGSAKKYTEY